MRRCQHERIRARPEWPSPGPLDAGDSWDFPQVGIGQVGADGPKVAISRDGTRAVVAYYLPARPATGRFITLSTPRGSSVGLLNELEIPFEKSGCSASPVVRPHPAVSAGAGGFFYLAARVDHGSAAGCSTPGERLEVVRIRSPTSLATAETILSVPVPKTFEGMVLVDPTTSPVSALPARTRENVAPSMAVTRTGDGDDALALVMLNPVMVAGGTSSRTGDSYPRNRPRWRRGPTSA